MLKANRSKCLIKAVFLRAVFVLFFVKSVHCILSEVISGKFFCSLQCQKALDDIDKVS